MGIEFVESAFEFATLRVGHGQVLGAHICGIDDRGEEPVRVVKSPWILRSQVRGRRSRGRRGRCAIGGTLLTVVMES